MARIPRKNFPSARPTPWAGMAPDRLACVHADHFVFGDDGKEIKGAGGGRVYHPTPDVEGGCIAGALEIRPLFRPRHRASAIWRDATQKTIWNRVWTMWAVPSSTGGEARSCT